MGRRLAKGVLASKSSFPLSLVRQSELTRMGRSAGSEFALFPIMTCLLEGETHKPWNPEWMNDRCRGEALSRPGPRPPETRFGDILHLDL
jgi:hypothetical protein